jgi:hypothetical protein
MEKFFPGINSRTPAIHKEMIAAWSDVGTIEAQVTASNIIFQAIIFNQKYFLLFARCLF